MPFFSIWCSNPQWYGVGKVFCFVVILRASFSPHDRTQRRCLACLTMMSPHCWFIEWELGGVCCICEFLPVIPGSPRGVFFKVSAAGTPNNRSLGMEQEVRSWHSPSGDAVWSFQRSLCAFPSLCLACLNGREGRMEGKVKKWAQGTWSSLRTHLWQSCQAFSLPNLTVCGEPYNWSQQILYMILSSSVFRPRVHSGWTHTNIVRVVTVPPWDLGAGEGRSSRVCVHSAEGELTRNRQNSDVL